MIIKKYKRGDFDFWTEIQTHWGDMDGLRHINHAKYLTYMETARLDLYKQIGHDLERWDQVESSILASMEVNYIGQAVHPSTFDIGQRITMIGTKSYKILTAIFKKGEEKSILQANFILVSINYNTGKTIPVPDEFKKYLNSL
jgi:acyl-CoA thioester hydrolase